MNKFMNFIKESFRNHNSFFVISSLAATALILMILFVIMANVTSQGLSLFFGGVPDIISKTEFKKSVLDNLKSPNELSEEEYKMFLAKFKSEEDKEFFQKVYGKEPQNSTLLGFIDENIYPRDTNLDSDEKQKLESMFESLNYRTNDHKIVKDSFYFYRRYIFNREGILEREDETLSILKSLGLKNIGQTLKMSQEEFEKQVVGNFALSKIDPAIVEAQKKREIAFVEKLKSEDKIKDAQKAEAIPMDQRIKSALLNLVSSAYVYNENYVLKDNVTSDTKSKIADIFRSINFKYTSIIEFIVAEPKKGFEHGGVWQPIFGTVALVIIMTIAVVPIGVVTAIYLHEYAGHGRLTKVIRLAVNNLAGVPAIVFGLFGLGFFIQFVGQGFDFVFFYNDTEKVVEMVSGTDKNKSIKITHFKGKVTATLKGLDNYKVVGGKEEIELSEEDNKAGKTPPKPVEKPIQILSEDGTEVAGIDFKMDSFLFIHTFDAIVKTGGQSFQYTDNALGKPLLLDGNRYNVSFSTKRENKKVLGQPAILWAAFTLALLTLPVVIVSTEEALSNIPNDIRAASYALGATKFQTIMKLVIPNSLSGIMTGGILAVSRGAGEVAPILFTGAAYFNKDLPTKLNDEFMELGYHIFIMATQAPNIELTKPILYSTVLTLLVLTFLLNLLAIVVRFQLRAKFKSLH